MSYPSSELVIDPVLIRKYDVGGPRYPLYPAADRFVEACGEAELRQWLAQRRAGAISPALSACVRLPSSAKYIGTVEREMTMLALAAGRPRRLAQLHWIGPEAHTGAELRPLMQGFQDRFGFTSGAEVSLEADPGRLLPGSLAFLAELGFNRASLAAQAGAPERAAAMRRAVGEARMSGYRSVSLELDCAPPECTLDGLRRALDELIALDPDRIVLGETEAPSAEAALQGLTLAVGRLARADYLYIGMGQFARPDDPLAAAQAQGRLQRGFQGYSVLPEGDVLALGPGALGKVGRGCYQNAGRLEDWSAALEAGRLPVARGLALGREDLVRRAVIEALACQFRVSIESIELAYLVDFRAVFARELEALRRLAREGLVELSREWIDVTPKGRLLVRAVCRVFDPAPG